MFLSFLEANNGKTNNCNVQESFTVSNPRLHVGDTISKGDGIPVIGYLLKGDLIYYVVNDVITEIYQTTGGSQICEDLANHGLSRPHIFGQYRANSIVGHVAALSTPQFKGQDGIWKPCQYLGQMRGTNLKSYLIKETYFGTPFNVNLRTKQTCTEYPDVRNTSPNNSLREDKYNLTSFINATYNSIDLDLQLSFSKTMPENFTDFPCYTLFINKQINNLQYRINNGTWHTTIIKNVDTNGIPMLHTADNNQVFHPKDYCIDFTTNGGQTINRYVVRCTSVGGHFAVISTIKNLQNGKYHVSILESDILLDTTLEVNGIVYNSDLVLGNSISIGTNLTSDTIGIYKSKETGVIIDNQIKILSI